MVNKLFFLSFFICFFVVGCSSPYATTGNKIYMDARNGYQLVIPGPLTNDNISNLYVLPKQAGWYKPNITPPSQT